MNINEIQTNILKIVSSINELSDERKRLLKLNSKIDIQINNCYHIIELLPLNAIQLMKVTRKIKKFLQERRDIKESINLINTLLDKVQKIKSNEEFFIKAESRKVRYINEAREEYEKLMDEKLK